MRTNTTFTKHYLVNQMHFPFFFTLYNLLCLQNFLKDEFQDEFWIGLTYSVDTGDFTWIDGSVLGQR